MVEIKYSKEASDLVDNAFRRYRPTQDDYEIKSLVDHLVRLSPKLNRVVEIGVAGGGTLNLWSEIAELGSIIIGVDIDPNVLKSKLTKEGKEIHYVIGDTTQEDTFNKVRGLLASRATGDPYGFTPVDFLFIDGGHEYRMVKQDFIRYAHLVRRGGIVAFHDVNNCPGVRAFWQEIKKECANAFEYVNPDKKNNHGQPEPSFGIGGFIK